MSANSRYDTELREFRWRIPEYFNIGIAISDRWAASDPDRVAILEWTPNKSHPTTFGQLSQLSNRLANVMSAMGLTPGDRVGVLAPQRSATAIAHAAIYKSGAIAVPLFGLFGLDALRFRLADSGARWLIADKDGEAKFGAIAADLPSIEGVISLDPASGTTFEESLADFSPRLEAVNSRAEDPALIIYTSGTTGTPKGALHGHRVLLGHLPGVEMSHDDFPQAGDRIWTPADWAWIGGLLDVLLPSLFHGVTVVAHRFEKFDPTAAVQLMQECQVRNVFFPPTALKMLRQTLDPKSCRNLSLRTVASGGESLGPELLAWGQRELGVTINEFYGQTECNIIVSSCGRWFAPKPSAMGKAVPGHTVTVIDDSGARQSPGTEGNIAVLSPDPVMFLGYWEAPEATRAKFTGDWLVTGDRGHVDEDGFIHFVGREDDVITSSGYRIGPGEIEDCLLKHEAVAMAGVVGLKDELRTEVVAAFLVLREGHSATDELKSDIQSHVRSRLGAHQYPRVICFVPELPMTVSGKIIRSALRQLVSSTELDQQPVGSEKL